MLLFEKTDFESLWKMKYVLMHSNSPQKEKLFLQYEKLNTMKKLQKISEFKKALTTHIADFILMSWETSPRTVEIAMADYTDKTTSSFFWRENDPKPMLFEMIENTLVKNNLFPVAATPMGFIK